MAQIKWGASMSQEDRNKISKYTLGVLNKALDASKNPNGVITSGHRPAERQASVMYDNLSNGIRISYLEPGQIVTRLYDDCVKKKFGKMETIAIMAKKIEELARQNKLVSKHTVTEEQYKKVNVVDISKQTANLPNPRDFVKELLKEPNVVKVLTPFTSDYGSNRAVYSKAENAIHIEIKQP